MPTSESEIIAVVGLGYVGLPVAIEFARQHRCIGFDIDETRIEELQRGHDRTGEASSEELDEVEILYTDEPRLLSDATVVIVTVPTPVDDAKRPDFSPLRAACETVGSQIARGVVVVFESTVYPGATTDLCKRWLEDASGMQCPADFSIAYSPERINPGDRLHRLASIVKVVAGFDPQTAERVASLYRTIIDAGVHVAPSIEVAEAAKVIENTQRDLNIALMNELALIFERLGIRTRDVLEAAETKWNFLPFKPGLVGGHCIGVDPYYLTSRAQSVGYHPEVILAGRRINDSIGEFVAHKALKMLLSRRSDLSSIRLGILGLSFKEDVPDLRNSRVPDIIRELADFGLQPLVHDPLATTQSAIREYGIELTPWEQMRDLDAMILAVPHRFYRGQMSDVVSRLAADGVLVDVKSVVDPGRVPGGVAYWSL